MAGSAEQIVKAVLSASPLVGHAQLAEELKASHIKINRNIVSRIRCGKKWANIMEELPRPFIDRPSDTKCSDCVHWSRKIGEIGGCTLEVPEFGEPNFARCCNAFSLNKLKQQSQE